MNQPLFIYADYPSIATATATGTATGLDPMDVLHADEDNVWRPASTVGTQTVVIDLGIPLPIGCVALVGEQLAGVQMSVAASTDNFVASNVAMSPAAAIADFTTAWRSWGNASYRYWSLAFTGVSASFAVAHVALCSYDLLPYHADGHDPDVFLAEGDHLVSLSGYYLGAAQKRAMRSISLAFGQVLDTEYVLFQRWADACVRRMQPFFYVPDSADPTCYFGWADAKYKFSAPYKKGIRNLAAIPFNARMV